MRSARTLIAIVLAAHLVGPAHADEMAALARGEIVVRTEPVAGSDLPRAIVRGVIDAPPARVWPLIDRCQDYVNVMPRIRASKEIERAGDTVLCEITVALPFPMSDLTSRTRAVHVIGPPLWRRSWTLVEGDYDANEGSWTLEPYGENGAQTLATYSVHAIPHTSVPAWARRRAQTSSMPEIIERIREEVRRRDG